MAQREIDNGDQVNGMKGYDETKA